MTDTAESGLPQLNTGFSVDDVLDHYQHVDITMPFYMAGETPKHTKEDFGVAVIDAFLEQFPNEREAIGLVFDPRLPENYIAFRARKRLIASPNFDLQLFGNRIEALLAEREAFKAKLQAEALNAEPQQD
ncbi:hypothetical protein [Hyphomicrobium sp.]|uniref:hypothetical protein n=1 Tax=Hyphomicrobium sp. TaxID=82 RepID=UPI001D6718C8|nr:hypothetical protein [Hyphomicrobium sp.]MBY0559921.1 hypothetical protein [Hyphomicrobium sp.]